MNNNEIKSLADEFYPALTPDGQHLIRRWVGIYGNCRVDPMSYMNDAEFACANASDGEDIVIEIAAFHSDDGEPHTLRLERDYFTNNGENNEQQ